MRGVAPVKRRDQSLQFVLEGWTIQSPRARSGASFDHLLESLSAAFHLHKSTL